MSSMVEYQQTDKKQFSLLVSQQLHHIFKSEYSKMWWANILGEIIKNLSSKRPHLQMVLLNVPN
jgi:hypothetical protein